MRIQKQDMKNIDKIKSPFIQSSVTIVLVIILLAMAFIFLIFRSNAIYDISVEDVQNSPVMQTISMKSVTSSLDSGSASSNILGTISSDEWYTDMPNLVANTSGTVKIGAMTAYTSSPWDSTSGTYFYNAHQAKLDLWDYLNNLGVSGISYQKTRDFTDNNYWTNESRSVLYNPSTGNTLASASNRHQYSSGTWYSVVDGIDCVYFANVPALYDRTYYSSGNWAKKSNTITGNDTNKYCIILVPKGSDLMDQTKWVYLPAITADCKGHTYPWGVTQTNITVSSSTKVYGATSSGGDYGWSKTVSDIGTETNIKDICTSYQNGNYKVVDYLYCILETNGWKEAETTAMTDNYDMVGFMVYP